MSAQLLCHHPAPAPPSARPHGLPLRARAPSAPPPCQSLGRRRCAPSVWERKDSGITSSGVQICAMSTSSSRCEKSLWDASAMTGSPYSMMIAPMDDDTAPPGLEKPASSANTADSVPRGTSLASSTTVSMKPPAHRPERSASTGRHQRATWTHPFFSGDDTILLRALWGALRVQVRPCANVVYWGALA